jgi:ribonuclease HII
MFDLDYFKNDFLLFGTDEVGRGPIAGPVNACTTCLEAQDLNSAQECLARLEKIRVTDSKKLSNKRRKEIFKALGQEVDSLEVGTKYTVLSEKNYKLSFVITEKSHSYIDEKNILFASLKCMEEGALHLSKSRGATVLVDGNKTFMEHSHLDQHCIVKGDSKSLLIGLASIIAKGYRDNYMVKMGERYPGYGLEKHAGYPTKTHKEAVATLGVTPIHRRSFKGVKEFCQRS